MTVDQFPPDRIFRDQPLRTGGPGGTYNDMERVAALEAHMEHVRDDVRDIKDALTRIEDKLGDKASSREVANWSLAGIGIGLALFAATIGVIAIAVTVWGPTP
ncbi:hypothetical protein ACFOGJ_09000 [Marinibaculum pumilum]|uniref:Uncharacterized protein n=1 Tax=Marinibaculum pumilum TaxID=1766165 RepID=A0ABV7KY86_9PROT